jgi:hypothetical protein
MKYVVAKISCSGDFDWCSTHDTIEEAREAFEAYKAEIADEDCLAIIPVESFWQRLDEPTQA